MKALCKHFITGNFTTCTDYFVVFRCIMKHVCLTYENEVTSMLCMKKKLTWHQYWWSRVFLILVQCVFSYSTDYFRTTMNMAIFKCFLSSACVSTLHLSFSHITVLSLQSPLLVLTFFYSPIYSLPYPGSSSLLKVHFCWDMHSESRWFIVSSTHLLRSWKYLKLNQKSKCLAGCRCL